jgi:multimeric flavodoxin WrbA
MLTGSYIKLNNYFILSGNGSAGGKRMKVVAFNGSPHREGNTYSLVRHTLDEIEKTGIETELIQIGGRKVHPCTACAKCFENRDRKCVIGNDMVNECIGKMVDADAIIIATPTYFAGVTPEIKAFMDRAFLVAEASGNIFRRKLGAGIAAERRSGAVCAVDAINHYFLKSGMFAAGSRYWNNAKGLFPGEVEADEEGIDTMKQLGENIAWFIGTRPHSEDTGDTMGNLVVDRGDPVIYGSAGKRIHQ